MSPPSTSRWAPTQRTFTSATRRRRSPHACGWRLEPEAGEDGLALPAEQKIEIRLSERRLLGAAHHRGGIEHGLVGVLGGAEGFLDLLTTRRRVGGIDEARVHLSAGHVVERL